MAHLDKFTLIICWYWLGFALNITDQFDPYSFRMAASCHGYLRNLCWSWWHTSCCPSSTPWLKVITSAWLIGRTPSLGTNVKPTWTETGQPLSLDRAWQFTLYDVNVRWWHLIVWLIMWQAGWRSCWPVNCQLDVKTLITRDWWQCVSLLKYWNWITNIVHIDVWNVYY